MKRYCLALDLKNDPELIEAYKEHHKNVWPEIEKSIIDSGINSLEIYLIENRLFMILECIDSFTFEEKSKFDKNHTRVQEWETLMWNYQQELPWAKNGEKWLPMEQIFKLTEQP